MRRTAHSLVRGLASLSPALRLSAPLRAPVAHLAPVRRFVAVPAASSATAAAAPTAVAPAAASAASASIPADATAAAAPVSAATSTPVVKKSSADDEKKKAFRKRFMAPLLYFAISALTLTAGYMFLRHKRYEDKKKEILAAPNAALEPTTLRYIADTYMLSARDLDRIHSILVKDGTAGAVGFDDANDVVFGAVKAHRDARAALFAATAGLREKMEAIVTAERAASKHLIATARAEAEAAAAAEGKGEGAIKAAGDAAEKAAKESTPQFVATTETEALKREARVLVSRTDIPLTEIDDWYGDKDTDERPVRPWDPLVLFRTSRPLSGKNIPITDAMFALAGIMTEFLPPTHPASPAFCPRSILAAPVDTLSKEDLIRRESHLEAVFKHRSRAAKTRRAIDLQPQQRLDMAWRLAADATGADCRPSPPVEGQEEGGVKPPQLPQLSFAEFTAMINAMRRAGHFDLDSLLTTKAWPVRWRAVTPVEISEKYFAAFGKTEKDMISFGEFEAASYKFAEVSEPYLWYLEPDDPSLFGISAAINRHRWRYEASQGRSFVTPPAVPRAHAMAYAASKETARVRAEAFEKIKSLRASAAASSASNAAAAAAAAAVAAPVVAAAPAPVAATPAAGGADAGGK